MKSIANMHAGGKIPDVISETRRYWDRVSRKRVWMIKLGFFSHEPGDISRENSSS